MRWIVPVLSWPLAFESSDIPQPQPQELLLSTGVSKCNAFKSFTALGDSYAGGYGAETRLELCNSSSGFGRTCTTKACGQDIGSYAYRFAQKYSTSQFQNLACNGNDTGSVLNSQVNAAAFGKPDLVTVNMGGDNNLPNDSVGFFARVVQVCVVQYDKQLCKTAMQNAANVISGLDSEYRKIFAAIRTKAPNVTLVAMSYAQFWGNLDTKDCAWPLNIPSKQDKVEMNILAKNMNAQLKKAAQSAGYLYADVDAAFEGHRLCDATGADSLKKSWFQLFPRVGIDTGGNWYDEISIAHPTLDGQSAMLKTLETVLGC